MADKKQQRDVALRKRQQIDSASRLMFFWVAGASVIIGASFVLLWVLGQKLVFNEKVLAEKQTTVSALEHNNSIVEELKNNVRVLNTNQSLIDLKTPADTEPVQVVLDALPATANSVALGASLQSDKLLLQPGVEIVSLNASSVAGVENQTGGSDTDTSTETDTSGSDNAIHFDFSVSVDRSNAAALKDIIQRLERSIRSISITSLQVEQQGDKLLMTVNGEAYYQPVKNVTLDTKKVRP